MIVAICLAGAFAASALTVGPAYAFDTADASLTMVSDPGDTTGFGETFDFSTAAGDRFNAFSDSAGSSVTVFMNAANGQSWTLHLAAPAGEALTTRTYPDVTDFPGPGQPTVSITGIGFCGPVSGSFTVTNVLIVNKFVQEFDATFEQHCGGATAALHGELHLSNPPPPPPLQIGVAIDANGTASTVNGRATIGGTVTCSQDVAMQLNGEVTEVVHKTIVRGSFLVGVQCASDAPVPWQATVDPFGTTPYDKGSVDVEVTAQAADPFFDDFVTNSEDAVVGLARNRGI